jgi:hypothetical protein
VTRRLLAPLTGALLVAAGGCPLSQPLPEVARTPDGVTVSTPIILADSATPPGAISYLAKDCPGGAQLTLSASIEDLDTDEAVEARWFKNYVSTPGLTGLLSDVLNVPSSADSSNPLRVVPPLIIEAYPPGGAAPRPVDVVDLVVSNNFLALEDPTPPVQRAAPAPYLTQSYRWVIQYVDQTDKRAPPCTP